MASQANQALLRPFREVMKWASLAAVYAQDSSNDEQLGAQLQRSASSLLKDAERAVKRLSPYIENPTPELNAFLTDLVLRNADVIAEYRAVDILLYDFEDYIEAASYDAAKFSALQSAIKTLALLLLERIQRFTTESALDSPPPSLRPLPPLPARANISKIVTQPAPPRPTQGDRDDVSVVSGPGSFIAERKAPLPPRQAAALPADLVAPRLSSKFAAAQTVTELRQDNLRQERQERQESLRQERQDRQDRLDYSPPDTSSFVGLDRVDLGSPISMSMGSLVRPGSSASARTSQASDSGRRDYPYRPRLTSLSRQDQIHEEDPSTFDEPPQQQYEQSQNGYSSPDQSQAPYRSNSYRPPAGHQRTSSSVSRWPQAADDRDFDGSVINSSTFSTSSVLSPTNMTNRDSTFDKKTSISSGATSHSSARGSMSTNPPKTSCTIGPDSTLHLLGNFCKGARAFAAGGPGQAIKKVGGQGGTQQKQAEFSSDMMFGSMLAVDTSNYAEAMSQCIHCEYKTIYSQLLQDMDNDPLAKQQARGMTYRSRFLYKSHVAVKDFDRVFYACVFCDRTKATCHEGDATVFQSVDHLFRHLARHPLPLPSVPGITVLYDEAPAKGSSAQNQQDFDLILPDVPPALPPGPPADAVDYIASLPAARAIKDHIRRRNEKPQSRPDNVSEVLQFLNGARILGVEYPDKWDGKWCQGWHDGVLGVFPSKIIQLEVPERVHAIIKSVPRSLRTGVAKWEWDPKARTGAATSWLTFSKGGKITNLGWDDPHAWYWIGSNSRGMIGIFPKSHIRIETIQDGSLDEAQGAKPAGSGRSRLGSLFGRK